MLLIITSGSAERTLVVLLGIIQTFSAGIKNLRGLGFFSLCSFGRYYADNNAGVDKVWPEYGPEYLI
jgi:hypothetical protein